MPYMPLYVADFLVSTHSMPEDVLGVYIRLLLHQWDKGGLPNNQHEIARLGARSARVRAPKWRRIWRLLSAKFGACDDGLLRNPRLEHERVKALKVFERNAKGGRARAATAARARGQFSASEAGKHGSSLTPGSKTKPISTTKVRVHDDGTKAPPSSIARGPIIQKRRPYAAFEGPRGLYVPQALHNRFVALRNHPGAERELDAWYADVCEAWTYGIHARDEPGTEMFDFWRARFNERWPAAPARTNGKPTALAKNQAWLQQRKGGA